MLPKPRIKKSGCLWIVLTLQKDGYYKGQWTYEACHQTLKEALAWTKWRYFS